MNSALRTIVVGGVLGVGVVSGGALAFAQSGGTTVPPATEAPGSTAPATVPDTTEPPVTAPGTPAPPATDGAEPTPPAGEPGHRGGKGRKGAGKGHHGHLKGRLAASGEKIAAELGVTVDQLREAHKAARQAVKDQLGKPERPATRPPSEEAKAKMLESLKARAELYNKTLAEKLGVTPDRLRDARIAVVTRGLDEAVTAGKLTREQADKILAEIRDGVDGDGFRGGFGHKFGHK
jgi:pyruvate/2-oxoglutarate dehydrogenase complex dihydrolipoamide acyltransferase (E2) component